MPPRTWVIIGASRGIGLEFVRQLLARGDQVIAAVRDPVAAGQLWKVAGSQIRPGSCVIEHCDVTSELSIEVGHLETALDVYCDSLCMSFRRIKVNVDTRQLGSSTYVRVLMALQAFARRMNNLSNKGINIYAIVLNAGVLKYPNVCQI